MTYRPRPLSAQGYLLDLFSSRSAREGGVVRRSLRSIDRYIGRQAFLAEMDRRGFTAIVNAGQVVIFCNSHPVRRLTTAFSDTENAPGKCTHFPPGAAQIDAR